MNVKSILQEFQFLWAEKNRSKDSKVPNSCRITISVAQNCPFKCVLSDMTTDHHRICYKQQQSIGNRTEIVFRFVQLMGK